MVWVLRVRSWPGFWHVWTVAAFVKVPERIDVRAPEGSGLGEWPVHPPLIALGQAEHDHFPRLSKPSTGPLREI